MILHPDHDQVYNIARKRVTTMDTTWLLDFADQSITGAQMGLDDWRKHQQVESLTEIWGGMLVLMAVVGELEARWEAQQGS
jgi:hypothetical protein